MSVTLNLVAETRLVAREVKATKRPSPETDGSALYQSPDLPPRLALTSPGFLVLRLRTYTSRRWLRVSCGASGALDTKATERPSAEMAALVAEPCLPLELTLTRNVL